MGCDDAYHAYGDNDDHLVAETLGGTSHTARTAGIGSGLPFPSSGSIYLKHPYKGLPGLLGAPCQICGGISGEPVHLPPYPEEHVNPAEIITSPVVFLEVTGEHTARYEFENITTAEAIDIVVHVLPDVLNRFLTKNKDYERAAEADLGPKAHFVGINRKYAKLRKGLWDEEPLEHEDVVEIIDDMIGHLLLARLGLTGPKA